MGSRGRMLAQPHWSMPSEYRCIGLANNIKILELRDKSNQQRLPAVSHTKGTNYISLDKNGIFHQMRVYDYAGHPSVDIDYGVHASLGSQPTLHVHSWKGGRENGVRLFTKKDLKRYGKRLKGLIKDEWIH